MHWQETTPLLRVLVSCMNRSLITGREGSVHGGAVHLYWHKVALNMQKRWLDSCPDFSEHQHICVGIAFHRREQAVSLLERTFWLKKETPATVNLVCKKQQKGGMNSKCWDKVKWDFLHFLQERYYLLLQWTLKRRIPVKRDWKNQVRVSAETQMA